jgi:hypothetical protein
MKSYIFLQLETIFLFVCGCVEHFLQLEIKCN